MLVSPAQAITYSGPCAPSRTRGVSRSSFTLPPRSMTPVTKSSASREINPEPQMPRGLPPPITRQVGSRVLELTHTSSMAPSVARIPSTTPAPSKAGPAEQAQATCQSCVPSTISPFVPTSMNSVSRSVSERPQARTPAVMSEPT